MKKSVRNFLGLAAIMCAFQDAAAIPLMEKFKPAPKFVREYSLAVKDAALGGAHSVLLLENGKLRCTGWNGAGECEPPPGLTDSVQVVAGNRFSAARNAAGKITTWGKAPAWPEGRSARWLVADNETLGAVLDDGSLWTSITGILDTPGTKFTKFVMRHDAAGALSEEGTVYRVIVEKNKIEPFTKDCTDVIAGFNRNHPIIGLTKAGSIEGDPGTYFHPFKHVLKMELTGWSLTVVTADGKLQFWSGEPVLAEVMRSVKTADVNFIRGGESAGLCALKSGRLLVWGWDRAGLLQFGAPSRPKRIIVEGAANFIVVREDGSAVAFGHPFRPGGIMHSHEFPLFAGKIRNVRTESGVISQSIFVITDRLWAFGLERGGVLNLPEGLKRVEQVETGGDWAVARTADGKLWKWGERADHFTIPQAPAKCVSVAAMNFGGVSVYEDGSVIDWVNWRWTDSPFFARRPDLPVKIKAVAAGWDHILALSADGKVFAWGTNSKGQCNVPADLTSAVAIAGGYEHSAALLGDGKLRVWGDQVPPVSELPELVSIAAGNNVTAGITKDGGVVVISAETGQVKRIPLFGVFDRP